MPMIVTNVNQVESMLLFVLAQWDNMMMVLPNVKIVNSNVLIVNSKLITVLLVLVTESTNQNVPVHSLTDTMKLLDKLNVQNVTTNVKLVLIMKLVKFVLKEEMEMPQFVIAHMVGSKMLIMFVNLVTFNVKNVLNKLITVPHVPVTESKNQFVIAQKVIMKMVTKSVHNVTNTVFPVLVLMITVSNVLIPDTYHQSVHLFHNTLNLLKLLIFQSVLLLLSLVKPNV